MSDYNLRETLIKRDGLSESEVDKLLDQLYEDLVEAMQNGEDPSEVIMNQVGLEPDYLEGFLF